MSNNNQNQYEKAVAAAAEYLARAIETNSDDITDIIADHIPDHHEFEMADVEITHFFISLMRDVAESPEKYCPSPIN